MASTRLRELAPAARDHAFRYPPFSWGLYRDALKDGPVLLSRARYKFHATLGPPFSDALYLYSDYNLYYSVLSTLCPLPNADQTSGCTRAQTPRHSKQLE